MHTGTRWSWTEVNFPCQGKSRLCGVRKWLRLSSRFLFNNRRSRSESLTGSTMKVPAQKRCNHVVSTQKNLMIGGELSLLSSGLFWHFPARGKIRKHFLNKRKRVGFFFMPREEPKKIRAKYVKKHKNVLLSHFKKHVLSSLTTELDQATCKVIKVTSKALSKASSKFFHCLFCSCKSMRHKQV